ncbi:hypothetical protein BDF14DRAFT_1871237 [Spinellus fusiger]|nr:hypothetical protein BDF14DRAFT_1871237 [Spinellus fusiger]
MFIQEMYKRDLYSLFLYTIKVLGQWYILFNCPWVMSQTKSRMNTSDYPITRLHKI